MSFTCTISGRPITKKNSQRVVQIRTRSGRTFPKILPSKAYAEWIVPATIQLQAAKSKARLRTYEGPVHVLATFYRARKTGDLDNFLAALGDALQSAKIIENDRQIISWDGSRLDKDANNPRIELSVEMGEAF